MKVQYYSSPGQYMFWTSYQVQATLLWACNFSWFCIFPEQYHVVSTDSNSSDLIYQLNLVWTGQRQIEIRTGQRQIEIPKCVSKLKETGMRWIWYPKFIWKKEKQWTKVKSSWLKHLLSIFKWIKYQCAIKIGNLHAQSVWLSLRTFRQISHSNISIYMNQFIFNNGFS